MVRLKHIYFSDVNKIEINQRLFLWSFLIFLGLGLLLFVPDMVYITTNNIDYPLYKGLLSNLIKFSSIALFIPVLFYILNGLNRLHLILKIALSLVLFAMFIMAHLVMNEQLQQWAGFRPAGKSLIDLVEYAALRGLEAQIFSFTIPVIVWYLFLRIRLIKENESQVESASDALKEILVKSRGKSRWIPVSEISHLESNDYYINLYQNDRVDLIRKSMDKMERELPAYFIRAHRSHIVNLLCVDSVERGRSGAHHLRLKNGKNIAISRSRYEAVKEKWLLKDF